MNDPSPARLLPLEPWPQRISRILAWLAGALILFGCSGLISIDVITRLIFGRGVVESFELSGYALAAAIGFGLAFTVTSKANVRVDILLDVLPRGFRAPCDLLASLSLSVIALALAWFCWKTVDQSMAMQARSISTLQVPMAIPQGLWWAGIFWFAFVAVLIPLQAMTRLIRRDRHGFDAMIGSLRVTEEMSHAGVAARSSNQSHP
jgi:TRAP-type C4-dicarboxylate transport system permease small subunit